MEERNLLAVLKASRARLVVEMVWHDEMEKIGNGRRGGDLRVDRAMGNICDEAGVSGTGGTTSLEKIDFRSFNLEPSPSQPCEQGTSLWHR